jgi:hypothetical protein
MKYLPKSKLGATVAGAYLAIAFSLILAATFGGGLRPEAKNFVYFLTFPLGLISLPVMYILCMVLTDGMPAHQANELSEYFYMVGFAVCAIINAAGIYLAVGLANRGLRALFRKPLK